jgi:hypothetical protein
MALRDAIGLTAGSVFLRLGGPTAALNFCIQYCRNPAHRRFWHSLHFQTIDHRFTTPRPVTTTLLATRTNDHSERLQGSAKKRPVRGWNLKFVLVVAIASVTLHSQARIHSEVQLFRLGYFISKPHLEEALCVN